jgi:integrase
MSKIAQHLGHDDDKTTHRIYARFQPHFTQDAAGALEL